MTKTLYIIIGAIVTLLPASQSLGQQGQQEQQGTVLRIPYQAEHRFTTTECGPSGLAPFQCNSTSFPSVPAGKRLVAERIVASASLASGTLVESRINVNNVLVSFSFVPTLTFSSGGGTSAVGDQTVLFYVDGGSSVQTAMFTDGAFGKDPSGGPIVIMSVIGYLLDCTGNVCPPIAP
jgi:hypothetical protein